MNRGNAMERFKRSKSRERVSRVKRERHPRGGGYSDPPKHKIRHKPIVAYSVAITKIKNPVTVGKIKADGSIAKLYYSVRERKHTYFSEVRWYYVGCVQVCALIIEKEPSIYGQYRVHISSWMGNNGNRFKTENQAHEFIIGELLRNPKEQPE